MELTVVADRHRESDLIAGCRRGDPAAQRAVFDRYRDRVYSIALRYLQGDAAAAEDVTQDVFIRAFRSIGDFREDARLSSWLYRVVVNRCLDAIRKRGRVLHFGEMPLALHPTVAPVEPDEPAPDIAAALDRLSPKLRLTVLLRHYDDLSYEELAEALGCSPGTVASRLSRAHAQLARDLAHRRKDMTDG